MDWWSERNEGDGTSKAECEGKDRDRGQAGGLPHCCPLQGSDEHLNEDGMKWS